jgi:VanZ family protein
MHGAIAENPSVRVVHEDLSTELTPQKLAPTKVEWVSRERCIFRSALKVFHCNLLLTLAQRMTTLNANAPKQALNMIRLWYSLGAMLLILVGVISLLPGGPDIGGNDKIAHCLTYMVIAAWFSILLVRVRGLLFVFFGLVFYGYLIERLQGMTDYRFEDVADMVANTLGVFIGLGFYFSPLRKPLLVIDSFLFRLKR